MKGLIYTNFYFLGDKEKLPLVEIAVILPLFRNVQISMLTKCFYVAVCLLVAVAGGIVESS